MADKKRMSVAEILAAARKVDGGGGESAPVKATPAPAPEPAEDVAAAPVAQRAVEEAPAKKADAPKPSPAAKPGGARPGVSDILALARAAKAGGATEAKPAAAPAPKPAVAKAEKAVPEKAVSAKAVSAKAVPAKAAKEGVATEGAEPGNASILVAARTAARPGPMSKAEAAKLAPGGADGKSLASKPGKLSVPPMPVKPAYAKPREPAAAPVAEERRWFLSAMIGSFLGVGFTSLAATSALWTLGTARFMFPNVLTEPPSRFKVGFPADFPPGAVEEKFKAQFGVWVVNWEYQGQQQIYALKTVCTHLGCTPNWLDAEQKFKCPCHGSGFYKDGINFEGPAPRPLERYAIAKADDGQLEIDKSKTFQEELGQWSDTASYFVPV